MDICLKYVVKLVIILLSLQVSRQAVPDSELRCTKDRLPRFDHTISKFAQWPASDECQTSYEVECEPGYEMTLIRTCDKNGANCQPPELQCNIISCPPPYAVPNATVAYNTTTYKSVATYTCDEGLFMTSGSPLKTCEADKQWTFDDPYCSLDRPTTTPSPNATTTPELTTTSPALNFTPGVYEPVVDVPERPPAEAPNAPVIGGICTFIFFSPLIFLLVIDIIQIVILAKAKILKMKAAKANQAAPV